MYVPSNICTYLYIHAEWYKLLFREIRMGIGDLPKKVSYMLYVYIFLGLALREIHS